MQEKDNLQKGWEFSVRLAGVDAAAHVGSTYIDKVNGTIEQLVNDISNLKSNQSDAVLGGYIAEYWHAGTFNIDAVAAESAHRANTVGSTAYASVDIDTNFGKQYSAKWMSTGEKSAVAQAAHSNETGLPKYYGQERLIPTDHMEEAVRTTSRRAASNAETRPEVAATYKDTGGHFTDRVSDEQGIKSLPLTKDDATDFAKKVKAKGDDLSREDLGVGLDSAIKSEYIFQQALKAGYTAAAITVAIQLAPDIYKSIDYLIKNGAIDLQQIKDMGPKAISTGADGFLRGSIAHSLFIQSQRGVLGEAFKTIDPTMLGIVVAIVLETTKNSILVAAGRITAKEMGVAFTDSIIISTGYVVGSKIGGIIGQVLGFELPVVGYLLGSLVGCAFATVYNISKRHLISFCVDTGYTCFGLVEQDYQLPEEVLTEMGIEVIPVPRIEVQRTQVPKTTVTTEISRMPYETIDITTLRRGVIGVNKVGYIY